MRNKEAKIPGRKNPVCFNERSIMNIFSLYFLSKEHQIAMDISKENAILVHCANGHINKFLPYNEIYMYKLNKNYSKLVKQLDRDQEISIQHLVTTLAENRNAFTDKQFQ